MILVQGTSGFPNGSTVKNLPEIQETQEMSVQSLGGEDGNGNTLHYSYVKNPMNREACQAIVHGVTKGQTRLSDEHFRFFTRTQV